ncbi:MAG: hypothetical protein PHC88_09400 [Terrimicrobiaceae bacterium]|nr:hypothetical protein [Terrimicrobiaceae bacterium]
MPDSASLAPGATEPDCPPSRGYFKPTRLNDIDETTPPSATRRPAPGFDPQRRQAA